MKSLTCTFIKESSTLRMQISFQREIILHSVLLSVITKELKKVFDEAACEILRHLFHLLDEIWLEEKNKDIKITKTVKNRSLKTIFGEILFNYRQAEKNGKYLCPLLETLGIDKYQRITDDLMDLVKRSALYTSYRKALKIGCDICALSTLWKAVQKDGLFYREKRNNAIYYYLEGEPLCAASPSDFAIVMIDEIWLRKKTKKVQKTAPAKKKKEYIKVKVARCSVARKKGDTYEWDPLRILATAQGSQKDFLNEARRFFNATSGLAQIPRIIVVTDGCPMGREFCALYAKGQALWQLDWWHLFNNIHKGCKFEKDLEKEVCGLIRVEKIDQALALLCAYREAMKCMEKKLEDTLHQVNKSTPVLITPKVFWSIRQRELLEDCITYIDKNKAGIYAVKEFVNDIPAEFLPFGSGPVERLQAVMVAYRMKKQGKHWSVKGADNLIQLLSREWNGDELERIIEEGIEGLSEWQELCSPQVPEDYVETTPAKFQKKKPCMAFSPLPTSCIPLLKRGRTDSCFTSLKRIGELKLVPHIVEFREGECQAS
jgi:hypothetical protein